MVPSEGEDAPFGLLVGFGEGGYAEAEGDKVVVLVDYKIGVFEGDEGHVFVDIDADFALGHGDEVVEVFEGVVDGVEHLVAEGAEGTVVFEGADVEAVFFGNERVDTSHFVGDGLVGGHFVLEPCAFDLHAHTFDEADVVFGVVEGGDVLTGIEVVDSPTFFVHVGETKGAFDFVHTIGAAVFDDFVDKGLTDVEIFDEVEPAETYRFFVPNLVDGAVDDGSHATYNFAVAIGEVKCARGVFKRGVFGTEKIAFIKVESGDVGWNVAEELVRESDETIEVATRGDFFDDDLGHGRGEGFKL